MLVSKLIQNRAVQRHCLIAAGRSLSTAPAPEKSSKFFRSAESDPSKHGELDHGLFYTIPQETANRLFGLGGWNKDQQAMLKCFRETSLMVREPALKIIEELNKADFKGGDQKRYVIHGRIGTGRTTTMNHLMHYGFENKFVIIHCDRPTMWTRFPQDYSISTNNPRRVDTPLDATVWLQHFRTQNGALLESLSLTCHNKYTWSTREVTEVGEPLSAIVEHGINRIKHSSDCVAVLLKELRLHANDGACKLMVAIERVNALWEDCTIRYPDKLIAGVDDVTIVRAFKKFVTQKDWKNGVLIGVADKKLMVPYRILAIANTKKLDVSRGNRHTFRHWGPFHVEDVSDEPASLLTDEGMKDFSPCQLVHVEQYSDKELMSCLDYYEDRKWITRSAAKTPDGREEIRFLSGNNPEKVYELCSDL